MPPRPKRGMDALAFSNGVYKCLDQIRGLVYETGGISKKSKDTLPPFWPTLGSEGEGEAKTYYVTITDGYVNERIPGGEDDALAKHFPDGLKDEFGERVKHTVVAGKQVSLVVEVDEDGAITASGPDAATRIEIEDVDPESTHYEPKIGDASTGEAGIYRYCLAKIVAGDNPGDPPKLENVLAGSHVSHFRELPKIVNLPETSTTGIARLIKEYDKPSNEYRVRSLNKGDGQLRIEEDGDSAKIRGNGKNFLLRIQVGIESAQDAAEFEDGLCIDEGTRTIEIPAIPDFSAAENLNLSVYDVSYANFTFYDRDDVERTATTIYAEGEPTVHYWRNGIYRGTTAPTDDPVDIVIVYERVTNVENLS